MLCVILSLVWMPVSADYACSLKFTPFRHRSRFTSLQAATTIQSSKESSSEVPAEPEKLPNIQQCAIKDVLPQTLLYRTTSRFAQPPFSDPVGGFAVATEQRISGDLARLKRHDPSDGIKVCLTQSVAGPSRARLSRRVPGTVSCRARGNEAAVLGGGCRKRKHRRGKALSRSAGHLGRIYCLPTSTGTISAPRGKKQVAEACLTAMVTCSVP